MQYILFPHGGIYKNPSNKNGKLKLFANATHKLLPHSEKLLHPSSNAAAMCIWCMLRKILKSHVA